MVGSIRSSRTRPTIQPQHLKMDPKRRIKKKKKKPKKRKENRPRCRRSHDIGACKLQPRSRLSAILSGFRSFFDDGSLWPFGMELESPVEWVATEPFVAVRSAWSRCFFGEGGLALGRGVIHSSTHPAGGRICSVVAVGVVVVNVLVICLLRGFCRCGKCKRIPRRFPQGSLFRGHSRIVLVPVYWFH